MATTSKRSKAAAHDPTHPQAFTDFMLQRWQLPSKKQPAIVKHLKNYQARRHRLSQAFPGETLVIPTGHERVRANDTFYRFRPGSDFFYLTGNLEPDCVLVFVPRSKGHECILFVEPNNGKTDTTFFADRHKGELWVGPRLGLQQSKKRFGVDRCVSVHALPAFLKTLKGRARVLRGIDDPLDRALGRASRQDKELAAYLSEMRLLKDKVEIALLQEACASTRRGFEDIIAQLPKAQNEREVDGIFNLRARVEGNDVGYNTIAASGAHACVLHWHHNDGVLSKRDLLLVDAGVESHALYTADVTRTLPISGRFSPAQREVYDLVELSQRAAFAAVKPGHDFLAPYYAAMEVLAYGLEQLGVLKSAEEALKKENQYFKRYTLHGVSHMLGLDVHDCAQARDEMYRYSKLQAGMVLTIEPGLYFQPDDLTVPQGLRGIGVRIEDDIVVTPTGYKILSDLPRTSKDVELWMHKIWKKQHVGFTR
jgi:Xaa-Pro aminopeptidase